jgi:hypothetical protein
MATTLEAAKLRLLLSYSQTNRPPARSARDDPRESPDPARFGVAPDTVTLSAHDAISRLDRMMKRLLEVWQRLQGRLDDPAALAELMAAMRLDIDGESSTPGWSRPATAPPMPTSAAPTSAPPPSPRQAAQAAAQGDISELARVSLEVRATVYSAASALRGTCAEGITVMDEKTLRTDRYEIRFEQGDTLRITDLKSGQYTRVWGDPHVDLSNVDGVMNGEFSDLKASTDRTTFVLQDGTQVRIHALDWGQIESIDVVRGGAAIHGIGMDPRGFGIGAFDRIGKAEDAPADLGDVVHAGDDGVTWYDSSGRLVWGAQRGRELGGETSRAASPGVDEGNHL